MADTYNKSNSAKFRYFCQGECGMLHSAVAHEIWRNVSYAWKSLTISFSRKMSLEMGKDISPTSRIFPNFSQLGKLATRPSLSTILTAHYQLIYCVSVKSNKDRWSYVNYSTRLYISQIISPSILSHWQVDKNSGNKYLPKEMTGGVSTRYVSTR